MSMFYHFVRATNRLLLLFEFHVTHSSWLRAPRTSKLTANATSPIDSLGYCKTVPLCLLRRIDAVPELGLEVEQKNPPRWSYLQHWHCSTVDPSPCGYTNWWCFQTPSQSPNLQQLGIQPAYRSRSNSNLSGRGGICGRSFRP